MSDLPGRADRTTYRRPTAPPRRPRRRATSPGTGAVEPTPVEPTPVEPAPDDSDVGWGDRPPADEETRYLADRPPHWGSD